MEENSMKPRNDRPSSAFWDRSESEKSQPHKKNPQELPTRLRQMRKKKTWRKEKKTMVHFQPQKKRKNIT